MITTNYHEQRRLILNAKQLYLFQNQAFQLRSQLTKPTQVEHCPERNNYQDLEDTDNYVLGYN